MMQGAWGGSHEPCGFHMGLNVNMNTERYQREDISAPYSSNHLLSQPGNVAYGIWTANYPQAILDKGHEWYSFGMDYTLAPAYSRRVGGHVGRRCGDGSVLQGRHVGRSG